MCSKINSSSLSIPNEIIIGDNLYRFLKCFPNGTADAVNNYYFINNGKYEITETNSYPTYIIRRTNIHAMSINKNNKKDFLTKKQLNLFKENEKRFFFHKRNNAKRIIIVDDEQMHFLLLECI